MTEKQTYWLVNAEGNKALASGAAERDRLVPLGWAETEEPTGDEFVWARHEGIADPARFPAASFAEVWQPRGWEPSTPPEPVTGFNTEAPAPAVKSADPAADQTPKSPTPAASGNTKEK